MATKTPTYQDYLVADRKLKKLETGFLSDLFSTKKSKAKKSEAYYNALVETDRALPGFLDFRQARREAEKERREAELDRARQEFRAVTGALVGGLGAGLREGVKEGAKKAFR